MNNYEDRIYDEILVDCCDECEQNMSWYYYVQAELEYPFYAYIQIKKKNGTQISKRVKVVDLVKDDSNFTVNFDLKVNVEFDDYLIEVPLGNLHEVDASEETTEIINIWKYWIKKQL